MKQSTVNWLVTGILNSEVFYKVIVKSHWYTTKCKFCWISYPVIHVLYLKINSLWKITELYVLKNKKKAVWENIV